MKEKLKTGKKEKMNLGQKRKVQTNKSLRLLSEIQRARMPLQPSDQIRGAGTKTELWVLPRSLLGKKGGRDLSPSYQGRSSHTAEKTQLEYTSD